MAFGENSAFQKDFANTYQLCHSNFAVLFR
jgi:hypothetical protein